jgi:hypothetical protein
LIYKRIEGYGFEWPRITEGIINKSQFEALFAGLEWMRVTAPHTRRPAIVLLSKYRPSRMAISAQTGDPTLDVDAAMRAVEPDVHCKRTTSR